MNTGAIASRYAKALLRYTEENGAGERVSAQVRAMLSNPDAASGALEPELQKFLSLVISKGRAEYIKLIFRSYLDMYYDARGIKPAHLTTVTPSPQTEEKLRNLLEKQLGCKVLIESEVDPSIIGGFVLEIDNKLLDASVARQIELIRRQFIISNNRIV